jgi:hypothetical protein
VFEKLTYQCPRCGFEIRQTLEERELFTCSVCSARFKVLVDEDTGKAAFLEQKEREIPEPLWIPRGSIRSLTALSAAFSFFILAARGAEIPAALLALLLTVVGYYFGFRARMKAARSRIFDASARPQEPLYLPGGSVRTLLILSFAVAGIFLHRQGLLGKERYLEFYVLIGGLVAGYAVAKIAAGAAESRAFEVFNHLKGAVVLAASFSLAYLFVSGDWARLEPVHLALLCAVVSFYYGSRT